MEKPRCVSLLRRLGAVTYDVLIILALALLTTVFWTTAGVHEGSVLYPLYRAFLFTLIFLYYGWFWTHGGQTVGMKTWKIKLVRTDGVSFNWVHAASRSTAALVSTLLLGGGFLSALFHPQRATWHDDFSSSYLVPE